MPYKGTKIGTGGARPGAGRTLNAIKELCREHVFNDQLVERLARIARGDAVNDYITEDGKVLKGIWAAKVNEQIAAAQILLERGFGKPEQSLDVTHHDDEDKPATEALVETIRVLREELGALREGALMAAKE